MKNILVIDDSRFILAIVEDALEHVVDAEVFTGKSYAEARELVASHTFHVAILDVHLPDAEQGEVIDLLDMYEVPVIVLTGGMNEKTKKIILEKELIEYVTKSDPNTVGYVANIAKRALSNYDKHVLVVDDSKSARALMRQNLEALKLHVHEAANGMEALQMITKELVPVSLVLTDFNMPVMDGLELTIALRQKYSKDQIGIIGITADSHVETVTELLRHGANDCIKKPFSPNELKARVNANLELIDLFAEVRNMANKDHLTGLFNRRYFFERSEALIGSAKSRGSVLAVAMIDIDHFKQINDNYGHDVGDAAIRKAANILASHVGDEELLARFGGEEFCMLIQADDFEEAYKRMQWLRAMFEANVTEVRRHAFSYTISIGVCAGVPTEIEKMIKCADEMLYEAKASGRNRVVSKLL